MEQIKINSIEDFKNKLEKDSDLLAQLKQDPISVVKLIKQQKHPILTDKWIYRIIVLGLSITIIAIINGVLILVGIDKITDDKSVPTILTAIGSAAIGAATGLLASSPKGNENS